MGQLRGAACRRRGGGGRGASCGTPAQGLCGAGGYVRVSAEYGGSGIVGEGAWCAQYRLALEELFNASSKTMQTDIGYLKCQFQISLPNSMLQYLHPNTPWRIRNFKCI